jgi:hypothetical protein
VPVNVSVRVPIEDAVAWDPWLTAELGVQAERLGLGYDGGETYGEYEVFDFTGDAEQVEQAVSTVLGERGVRRAVTRKGQQVEVVAEVGRWVFSYNPVDSAYARAMQRLVRRVSADPKMVEWREAAGLRKAGFQESHQPGRPVVFWDDEDEGVVELTHFTDLTILDAEPTNAEAEEVAGAHLHEVLQAVAEHLGHPLP